MSCITYSTAYLNALPTISRGSTDQLAVRKLQVGLNMMGAALKVDGDFGPGTEKACSQYLSSTTVGPAQWRGLATKPFDLLGVHEFMDIAPEPADKIHSSYKKHESLYNQYGALLRAAARATDMDVSALYAVFATETSGLGNDSSGMPIIRFENHIWWRLWGKTHPTEFNAHWGMDPYETWKGHTFDGRPMHKGDPSERRVLDAAARYEPESAYESISMGLPQIMGFNHLMCYYQTAIQMHTAFSIETPKYIHRQVAAAVAFFASSGVLTAIRNKDWKSFATTYNGSGQVDTYSKWLSENHDIAVALRLQ